MKNWKQIGVDSHTCWSGTRAFVGAQGLVGVRGQHVLRLLVAHYSGVPTKNWRDGKPWSHNL